MRLSFQQAKPAALMAALFASGALTATASAHRAAGRFAVPASADQLIVVSSPTHDPPNYLAAFSAYARVNARSRWRRVFGPWHAETGYGHLKDARHEGDGSTPTGVYGIGSTIYGNDPNPGGLHYAYHRLVCGDWWDEDPYSSRYNRFVHVPCAVRPAFAGWSEPLWTETIAYPYFAVIRFNVDPTVGGTRARGSGIFLHSWVAGATDGCVALPQTRLLGVLRWLDPARHPTIAIGTDRELGALAPS
jgi:L,D-peptidoglycan transpeptidase YkuD (ErfK/YbiS/YcfS/YnhG family)